MGCSPYYQLVQNFFHQYYGEQNCNHQVGFGLVPSKRGLICYWTFFTPSLDKPICFKQINYHYIFQPLFSLDKVLLCTLISPNKGVDRISNLDRFDTPHSGMQKKIKKNGCHGQEEINHKHHSSTCSSYSYC